jgi:hypothetical protein
MVMQKEWRTFDPRTGLTYYEQSECPTVSGEDLPSDSTNARLAMLKGALPEALVEL